MDLNEGNQSDTDSTKGDISDLILANDYFNNLFFQDLFPFHDDEVLEDGWQSDTIKEEEHQLVARNDYFELTVQFELQIITIWLQFF